MNLRRFLIFIIFDVFIIMRFVKKRVITFLGGDNLKIDYKNPVVASYLFVGVIFFILGFSNGFLFFLLGVISIVTGIKKNNKLS